MCHNGLNFEITMKEDYTVGHLIYDANIYDGMNTNMDDLPFYLGWLPKNKNARILELCCGTGRLTIPIAKAGYTIKGIDYTPSMLEKAREKASAEGVSIDFMHGDMRTLDLQEKYDLIFIPFNSIHHLYTNEDLYSALDVVKNHLKKEGHFILDCFNPNIQFIVEGEKTKKGVVQYTTNDGREIAIKETMRYENHTQINRITRYFFINGAFDSEQNLDMRLFFPKELDAYLKGHGFTICHKFGSFKEENFSSASEKQIFVCQKTNEF